MAPRKRNPLLLVAKIAVSTCLAWVFYNRISAGDLKDAITGIQLWMLIPLFGIQFFNSFISTVKWQIFLSASGLKARLGRLFSTYLAASFLNIFLPSNVGGDLYRIYDAGKSTSDTPRSTASVLADRISGFLAIVIFGLIGALASFGSATNRYLVLVPVAVFSLLIILIALIYQQTLILWVLQLTGISRFEKLVIKLETFFQAFQEYRRHRGLFLKVMCISFLFQFMAIVFAWTMAIAIGVKIPFILFCVYIPLIALLEAVPLSIFGVGFREMGYVIFMSAAAQPPESGLALSLLYVILTLLYSSIGGVILAVRHLAQKPEPVTE